MTSLTQHRATYATYKLVLAYFKLVGSKIWFNIIQYEVGFDFFLKSSDIYNKSYHLLLRKKNTAEERNPFHVFCYVSFVWDLQNRLLYELTEQKQGPEVYVCA